MIQVDETGVPLTHETTGQIQVLLESLDAADPNYAAQFIDHLLASMMPTLSHFIAASTLPLAATMAVVSLVGSRSMNDIGEIRPRRLGKMAAMNDVTRILEQLEQGDSSSADKLLPLVYHELRRLAAARLAAEKPGQTLQATALVHEAYLRLVGNNEQEWESRGHFFSAAAEAMRRLLIEKHRAKATQKRGGSLKRVDLDDVDGGISDNTFDLVALDEAIQLLAAEDADAAELVKLRIFAGLSVEEAGQALGIPRTSAFRNWTYGQTWLRRRLSAK